MIAGQLVIVGAETAFDLGLDETSCSRHCRIEISLLLLHDLHLFLNREDFLQLVGLHLHPIVWEGYNVHKVLDLAWLLYREANTEISLCEDNLVSKAVALEEKYKPTLSFSC